MRLPRRSAQLLASITGALLLRLVQVPQKLPDDLVGQVGVRSLVLRTFALLRRGRVRNDPLMAVLVEKAHPYDGASESECRLSVFLHGGSFTSQPGGVRPNTQSGNVR